MLWGQILYQYVHKTYPAKGAKGDQQKALFLRKSIFQIANIEQATALKIMPN